MKKRNLEIKEAIEISSGNVSVALYSGTPGFEHERHFPPVWAPWIW
jgi:hypothetical protein